ncbi:MAG: ThiF family adenylyltransferase [Solirubrobacterales bacterium]
MATLRPQLHRLLAEAKESRTLAQLEALGEAGAAEEPPANAVVEVSLEAGASPSRRLLAAALLDYVLRLDPLVGEVRVEGFEPAVLEELSSRLPLDHADSSRPTDFSLKVGGSGDCDLTLDAGGWLAALGEAIEFDEERVLNPIGPLAAACLGTGEVFKALFAASYPGALAVSRFEPALGRFSFYDYGSAEFGPELSALKIDATLLGLGGVGAGVLRALAVLRAHLHGRLRLIDHDVLDLHSLNRVTYATVEQAVDGAEKATCAKAYLDAACPQLRVLAHSEEFDQFKRGLSPRRSERRYETLITALDSDEVRHAAQRELPQVLIDGSTGLDLNVRVERVVFGQWGCLGCTRQAPPPVIEEAEGCGHFIDPRAPSVSFLAALPGTLAASELIKEAMRAEGSLRGEFQHVFYGAPNPEICSEPARREDCLVGCMNADWLAAYEAKYAA